MTDFESQQDEVEALQSIFTEEEFHSFQDDKTIRGQFNAFVLVPEGYTVYYRKTEVPEGTTNHEETKNTDDKENFEKSMNVQYLPPVQLSFKLPADYPSTSAPNYTIACPWLTYAQLVKLSKQLHKIWDENKGFVVLYSWAQFLKDECLAFLELEKSLDVSAVEEARRAYIKRCQARNREPRREALSNISNKVEEKGEGSSSKEEVCTALDVSSVCDNLEEEQARLVKLSLYDSGQSETDNSDKVAVDEASGSGVRKMDVSEMIAFDKDLEVKRSLYCSGPEEGSVTEVPKEDLEKPGPSRRKHQNAGRSGSRKQFRAKRGKALNQRADPCRGTVLSLPLTEPLWNIIADYNKMRRRKDFEYQMFCCAVCFEEKMGSQCMELESCGHVFCRECLTSFLNVCIMEGKVKQLSCPETDCDTELLQSEIRSLVSPELFAKYDSFLLSSTLDTLNVTYCPRKFCQYPVSSDNDTMALCPQCDYCFCPFCKMVYHGVEPCRFKLDSEETKALIKEYSQCSESRKAELEKRYGRKHLQQLLDTSLSQSWISDHSKQCPKCNSSIERTYGCNKMVCLRCNTPFCWLCFEILDHLNPYRHFQDGRCAGKLYLGMAGDDNDDLDDGDIDEEFDEDDLEFLDEGMPQIHFNIAFYI